MNIKETLKRLYEIKTLRAEERYLTDLVKEYLKEKDYEDEDFKINFVESKKWTMPAKVDKKMKAIMNLKKATSDNLVNENLNLSSKFFSSLKGVGAFSESDLKKWGITQEVSKSMRFNKINKEGS